MDRRTFLQGMAAVVGGIFTADLHSRFGTLELPGQEPIEIAAETVTDPTPAGSWLYWNGQVYPADHFRMEVDFDPFEVKNDFDVVTPHRIRNVGIYCDIQTDTALEAPGKSSLGVFGIFSDHRMVPYGRWMMREEAYMLTTGVGELVEPYTGTVEFHIDPAHPRIANHETFLQMRQYESIEAARRAFQDVQAFEAENG